MKINVSNLGITVVIILGVLFTSLIVKDFLRGIEIPTEIKDKSETICIGEEILVCPLYLPGMTEPDFYIYCSPSQRFDSLNCGDLFGIGGVEEFPEPNEILVRSTLLTGEKDGN